MKSQRREFIISQSGSSRKKVIKRVWVSRKRMESMEKRIADLEVQVQSQQSNGEISIDYLIDNFTQKFREYLSKQSKEHS